MAAAKKTEIKLPALIPEPDYPKGDGPKWISRCFGVDDCLTGATRYLSDDGDETAVVLFFANGIQQVFRPARLVVTRRLAEVLSAIGFPVPFYSPAQLTLIGQAIGRVCNHDTDRESERSWIEMASLVAGWAIDCLNTNTVFELHGRAGADVRAAIEHVRTGYVHGSWSVPLILEPSRGVLLAWTVPATAVLRHRLGTLSDGEIGTQLKRAGLTRARLAARPGPGQSTPVEMPTWVVPNGWQGVEVEMPVTTGDPAP